MRETAEIKAVNFRIVTAPEGVRENVSGNLQIIYLAPEGTTVKKGDILIKFDPSELLSKLNELEDQLDVELANYEKIKISQQTRMKRMLSNLDGIKYSHKIAKLQLELLKYESESRKEAARLNLKKSEIELKRIETLIKSQKIIDRTELKKLEVKINQIKSKIDKINKDIESLTVKAPIPGLVVYQEYGWPTRIKYKVGDKVRPGSWIIRLPDLTKMQAILFVNEIDRKKIWVGQKGKVYLDAYPGSVFHGKISSISTLSKEYKRNSNVKVFEVVFSIDESDPRLKPGLTACVDLEIESIPDKIFIPISSVFEKNGKDFVLVQGNKKPIEITTGKINHSFVIVEKGLKEGDRILKNPFVSGMEKLGYHNYKIKETQKLKALAEHFKKFKELGIEYNYGENRDFKKILKQKNEEISPEKVMELIKKNGGRISTEILDKLKNSSNQKIKVDNKKGR